MGRSNGAGAPTASPRSANTRLVLQEIWTTTGVNRAAIARRTGLSRTTVSDIVNDLIDVGVVEESGAGVSRGGRRPILLRPVADARALIGIEAGASHVDVVVMDLTGQVRASERVAHRVPHDVDGSLDVIETLVTAAVEGSGLGTAGLLGAGLAVSSPLDGDDLRHVSRWTMPAWEGVDVVDALEERLELPTTMDNDANMGALAERWWGAGRGSGDLTYIKLGVGVGAGHMIRGELYRGSGGTAGEIGHINVGGTQTCRCGLIGCLETEIGSDALVNRYAHRRGVAASTLTIDDLVEASSAGDAAAREVVAEAADLLGRAVAPILNLLNPGTVIFSGPLADAGTVFLDALRDSIDQRSLPKTVWEARIIVSGFKHLTVARGAATAALDRLFDGGLEAWHRRTVLTAPTGAG